MKELENKVALVSSSTRGIGLACAKALAAQGAAVYLGVRRLEAGQQIADELIAAGGRAGVVFFDASREESFSGMVDEVAAKEGRLDILVNNFGSTDVKTDLDVVNGPSEDFFRIVNTNLKSVYLPSKAAVPLMAKNGGGSIINIGSVGGLYPDLSRTAYGVSKAAIHFLTKDIAVQYARQGVRCNAVLPGFTATEQKVAAGVRSLFARAQNKRIIIATFASNIYRVQQIIDLAVEDGRKVAFSGRSMVNNTAMAQELGYMHIPEGTLISIDEINQYPPEQVVLVTTGSQGEPLSALSRMASCSHRQVRVGPGDFIIISAKPIPGNEKSVTKIVNGLLLLGAEVIYEGMYDVHVSGHACQEEQKLMLTLTRPKYFLPVHGEYKQLKKHAITAASLGIPTSNILIAENGSNIILSQDEMKLGEPVTAGAVMVDGLGVGDVGNVVLRDRKHLSEDGLVIIVATVDSKTGKVLAGPDLVSRGFVYVRENESLMDGAQSIVETALDRCVDEHVRDWNSVKTRVREALSSYIYRRTKRSPMILPILMEV